MRIETVKNLESTNEPAGNIMHERLQLETCRYSPESEIISPFKVLFRILSECWAYRGLMWVLFTHDLRAQYRQSYLGYLWLLIPIMSTTLIWMFLDSANLIRVEKTSIPYPAYVLTGSIVWTLFTAAVTQPMASFHGGQAIFMKLKVPPEAFIFSGLGKLAFDLILRVAVLVPAFMLMGFWPAKTWFLFPVGLLVAALMGTAIGYAMIPLGSLYGDVGRLVSTALSFGLYLTPVVYPPPTSGLAANAMKWNPMFHVVIITRDWLTIGHGSGEWTIILLTAVALVLITASMIMLRVVLPTIVERMGM